MRFSKFRFKWWLRWWPRYAKYLWSLLTRSALVINRSQRFSMRLRRSPSRSTLVMPTETADVTTTSETATTSELGITETQATRSNNSSATMQKCINTQIGGGSFFYLEPKQCHCTDQVWVNPYVNNRCIYLYNRYIYIFYVYIITFHTFSPSNSFKFWMPMCHSKPSPAWNSLFPAAKVHSSNTRSLDVASPNNGCESTRSF